MKKIDFTKKQYEVLLKIAFWGDWMINAAQIEEDEEGKEVRTVVEHIYSYFEKFNIKNWIYKTDSFEYYDVLPEKELELVKRTQQYEDLVFLRGLIHKLAYRDMIGKHGADYIDALSIDDYRDMRDEYSEFYEKEFEMNGLGNLKIVNVRNN